MMDSDIISLKVKKKIGNKHNKNIKYLPQKYDEKLCEEIKSKLTISKKKNTMVIYHFIINFQKKNLNIIKKLYTLIYHIFI